MEVRKDKKIGKTIKKPQDFLLDTVENVTIAKKSYETFYNIIEPNFYTTMEKISLDKHDAIKDGFYRENFWGENVVTQLDSRFMDCVLF